MAKRAYHYEYFTYTDNLCYGRMYLGRSRSASEARRIGHRAGKGCFIVQKRRVFND